MATRVYLASPGTALESVVEGVGAAIQSSFLVALTVDLSTTSLDASTRQIRASEVILALEVLTQYVIRSTWPPV